MDSQNMREYEKPNDDYDDYRNHLKMAAKPKTIILSDQKRRNARNALSWAMLKSLQSDILPEAESQDLKVIIISGIDDMSILSILQNPEELAQDLRTAYHPTSQTMVNNLGLTDGQEGVKAFLQKRKPVWSH
ncbi:ECHDC3 [Cervus elaphus hippelaphus]|uniref:ECHDC3 n=1 Tax=Cervus elaphus hippelaphus TaxID=46360 RepID=A0A212CBF3_CEREH|nr:ECHDC3 [Cervus elaphus hippelaphus]